jgi:hypothetical protein
VDIPVNINLINAAFGFSEWYFLAVCGNSRPDLRQELAYKLLVSDAMILHVLTPLPRQNDWAAAGNCPPALPSGSAGRLIACPSGPHTPISRTRIAHP